MGFIRGQNGLTECGITILKPTMQYYYNGTSPEASEHSATALTWNMLLQ